MSARTSVPAAETARHSEHAAHGLDPVAQALEPRAVPFVRPADAVVADLDPQIAPRLDDRGS